MKAYLIRSQTDGILTDRIFLSPPTKDEMTEVLGRNLAQHGHVGGVPVERFVSFVEVEVIGESQDPVEGTPTRVTGILTAAELSEILAMSKLGTPGVAETATETISFQGYGMVI